MKTLVATLVLLAFGVASGRAITLDAAMQQTLERNPEIQQARIALEQAAGRRIELHALAYPDARLDLFGGAQGGHRAGEPSFNGFGFVRGRFAQPLFNPAVPASWRRGNIEVLIAEQQLNVAIVDHLHAARMAFFSALYNNALANLGRAQNERLAANVSSETQRYEAGETQRSAVLAARSLEQELEPRIEDASRASGGAGLTLAQLTTNPSIGAPEGELQLRHADFDVARETERALAQRADLQLARLMVHAAGEDQRVAQATYFPIINAVAWGNYIPVTAVRRDSGGSPQRQNDVISSEIRVGAGFTWRVIDNGKTTGAVMRQRAIREANELILHRLEADVPRELERIHNTLRAIEARQKAVASAAAAAEQNVNVLQQNVAQGLSSQLEFRSAETDYLQTESALLTAAFEQNVALAEWDRATGRYFGFADLPTGTKH